MVIRLKLGARSRVQESGRGLGKGRVARQSAGRSRHVSSDDDSAASSTESSVPTPRGVLSSASEGEQDEDDSEEEDPFGSVLTAAEAATTKTLPQQEDKDRFEQSRIAAEAKLGGAVSSLAGSTSGRNIKRPRHSPASAASHLTSTHNEKSHNTSALGYFTGSPWAGTGTGGDKVARNGAKGSQSAITSADPSMPSTPLVASTSATGAETGKALPIKSIRFAQFDIDTWYQAPYPEEYSLVPDGRLWICEQCFKYMKSRFMASRHRLKCKMRHPPGAEIYRDGNVSVFEVDGRKNKIYCQNLCLLAKMFLDHKTLYYDVEPFLFYICCEMDGVGSHFVGYFSKEKRSPLNYNLSCIMTLPIRQRRGWGNFLIDLSYLLSKKEDRAGSPEKPLSDLGLLSYRNYWTLTVFYYLRTCSEQHLSLDDISRATAMTLEDVLYVLYEQDMITVSNGQSGRRVRAPATSKYKSRESGVSNSRPVAAIPAAPSSSPVAVAQEKAKEGALAIPTDYSIHFDLDYVVAHIKNYEAKAHLKVRPENLHWAPFMFVRSFEPTDAGLPDDLPPSEQDGEANTTAVSAAGLMSLAEAANQAADDDKHSIGSVDMTDDVDEAPKNGEATEEYPPPNGREKVLLHEEDQPDVILPATSIDEEGGEASRRAPQDLSTPPPSSTHSLSATQHSPSPSQSSAISTPSRDVKRRMQNGERKQLGVNGFHRARTGSEQEDGLALQPVSMPTPTRTKAGIELFKAVGEETRQLRASQRSNQDPSSIDYHRDDISSTDLDALGSDDPTFVVM